MSFNADASRGEGFNAAANSHETPATPEFGRTERVSIQVTDRQGEVFRAEVYRCVNVTENPELRQALESGAVYEVAAPDQGAPFRLALPIRYHDESAEIFALVLPDELRHREFALRAELLADLSRVSADLPGYIRNFSTIYGAENLARLQAPAPGAAHTAGASDAGELAADGGARLDPTQAAAAADQADSKARAELDEAWSRVEQEREQLARERGQLEEVRDRIDRERANMDEIERKLEVDRAELAELRSELQVRSLNLEQKEMQFEQGLMQSRAAESTQVVTDDQFVEVFQSDAEAPDEDLAAALYGEADEATELVQSPYAPDAANAETVLTTSVTRVDAVGVARQLEPEQGDDITVVDGRVLARLRVDSETLAALKQADELSFFVQGVFLERDGAHAHDYPFVGLLLAALDAAEQPLASAGWALDPVDPDDEIVLSRLDGAVALHAALYNEAGQLDGVYEILAPLHDNVAWVRTKISDILEKLPADDPARRKGAFREAADKWKSPDFERLGQLRHHFSADSFADATSPAEVCLAAGIVGFWSGPERLTYLIANRSFPVAQFEAIQKRVVRRAVQHGIYIERPLRLLALQMTLAADEVDLAERLIAEFAEVSVGLRPNDLDPLQEWENWDALVGLAEDVGANLDAEMLELAEASLKRAQDHQEAELARPVRQAEPDQDKPAPIDHSQVDFDPSFEVESLVVARRSEATGVTYFLPDDAVLDTFDDLSTMSLEDLELLLDDPKGRLEAAQMLVERFDAAGTRLALRAAEQMTAAEVAALARFVETKALELEGALVGCVKSGGPSATYIGARALAGMSSVAAIPTLVKALRDPKRRGNEAHLARVLAQYGDAIISELKRSIQSDGHDTATTALINELEQLNPGVIAKLAMDRSKKVRNAASAARGS